MIAAAKEHTARPNSIMKPNQDFASAEKTGWSKMETSRVVPAKLAVISPRAVAKKASDINASPQNAPEAD